MAQPSIDEAISTLLMVVEYQIDKDQATQILKISGNDIQTAINKTLDALAVTNGIADLLKSSDTAWDGTAFGNAGYGQHYDGSNTNTNVPSFRIDHDIDYANSGGPNSAAPTRPPSRTSQRPGSALSTRVGDVPMQSVEELDGQELGVVGNAGTGGIFQPATQNYYDSASWAMVPATKSTEYIPDAFLDAQRRKDGPGLIKPPVADHHIPALITILHSIPMLRNALLAPDITTSNYWRGDEWWKGNASAASIVVNDENTCEAASELEFLHEVQRLTAFLDASERTYASLETLLQSDVWTDSRFATCDEPPWEFFDELKFLLRWDAFLRKHAPTAQLDGKLRSTVSARGIKEESTMLEIPLNTLSSDVVDPTLYDYFDELLFDEDGGAHIVKLSNVLVLRLASKGPKRNCTLPKILFADRYLEEHRSEVEAYFNEKKKYNSILAELDEKIDKTKWHVPRKVKYDGKMEITKMLKGSMRAFEPGVREPRPGNEAEIAKDAMTFTRLQEIHDTVEKKLSALEDEKAKAMEALDTISKQFRAPIDDSTPWYKSDSSDEEMSEENRNKPTHAFKLWGIAKSKTEYYVCRQSRSVSEFDEKDEVWWHIKYSLPDSNSTAEHADISRNEVSLAEVIHDMREISDTATVVYANAAALAAEPLPLPANLEAFVKKDNMNFQQEIADEEARLQAMWNDPNEDTGAVGDWVRDNMWGSDTQEDIQDPSISQMSSTTLTPDEGNGVNPPPYNDEIQEEVIEIHLPEEKPTSKPIEMQEINGGMHVWAGGSNTSSETIGADPKSNTSKEPRATNAKEDVDMVDVDEHKTEHIENSETKKGG